MEHALKESIASQRQALAWLLQGPLRECAERAANCWDRPEELDSVLSQALRQLPYCKFAYALDCAGQQISATASRTGPLGEQRGRDRSRRPYLQTRIERGVFLLSDAYISENERRPSVTAVQAVDGAQDLLGLIGADFDLRELPVTAPLLYKEPAIWRQLRGDPAIRESLFQQTRAESLLDRHIDEVLAILEELMTERGVFHGKLHFSSNRATLWLTEDPYCYRILALDELIDPEVCLAYPRRPYPAQAVVPPEAIRPLLGALRRLRYGDETLYLRSGSINVCNGLVGLNFSCDGSHYMPYREFLDKDHAFWYGQRENTKAG